MATDTLAAVERIPGSLLRHVLRFRGVYRHDSGMKPSSDVSCVLIHGAWHGPQCWDEVIAGLTTLGRRALALDLVSFAHSLDSLTSEACRLVGQLGAPVVLVGHSRGGVVISQVAERLFDRAAGLIYISGFLLRTGESVLRTLRDDGSSPLLQQATLTPDRLHWALSEESAREMFYGSCGSADIQRAAAQRVPEPAAPMMTPVKLTDARFGRVPRTYVECLRDAAVPLALQRKMQAATPCRRVAALDTDHSPFFSAPEALASIIHQEAAQLFASARVS